MRSHLPSAAYTSQETFLREQEIFRQSWQFAAFTRQLAKHNDFITREIGGRSVVVQNFHGEWRAFQNVCSHRFSRIQTAPCGNRALQCPYHGWTYNAEGLPAGIPKRPRFDNLTPEVCQTLRLKPWRIETCGGLVFITENLEGPSLRETLGETWEKVAAASSAFGELLDTNEIDIDANWKVLVENTLESYHVNFVHEDTFRRLGTSDGEFQWQGPHSSWTTSLAPDLVKGMARPLRALSSRPFAIEGYHHQLLFPNVTLATTFGTTFSLQVFKPLTVSRTRFTSYVFATVLDQPTGSQTAILNSLSMSAVDFNRRVFEEDRVVCEQVQQGASQVDLLGMLSDEEARVGHFQQAYLAQFSSAVPYARRAVIVGAGDFGRELYGWLQEDAVERGEPREIVFANDLTDALDPFPDLQGKLISTITDYQPRPTDDVFIAIGKPESKLRIAEMLAARGARFGTFIHWTANVERTATLGQGVVICPRAVVSCRARVGDHVCLNIAASVGHDAVIGAGTTFSAHADVTGHAVLGTGVFLGSHAVVLPKVKVGEFATVAAGSVALRNVPARSTVIGVPAKRFDMTVTATPSEAPDKTADV